MEDQLEALKAQCNQMWQLDLAGVGGKPPDATFAPPECPAPRPEEKPGDFLNVSLTWSKSVENAGYEDNNSGY